MSGKKRHNDKDLLEIIEELRKILLENDDKKGIELVSKYLDDLIKELK